MPGTQNKLIVGGNIEIFCPIRQTTDHAKNPATIFWCLKFRLLMYLTTPILLYSCIKKIRRGATFGNFEKLNRQIINSEQLQKMGLIMLQWPQTLGWLDTPCTNWYPFSSQTLLSYSCFRLIEEIKKFFATYSLHLPQSFQQLSMCASLVGAVSGLSYNGKNSIW